MVEIIPKTYEEVPSWQKILLYFLVFLIAVIVFGYFYLLGNYNDATVYIASLEERAEMESLPEIRRLEEKITKQKEKIDDFSSIFSEHITTERFFRLIEQNTHPRVYFYEADINPRTSNVTFYGIADSFFSLGQQILIFEEQEMVQEVVLTNTTIAQEGGIDFSLDILLDKELFRYSTNTQEKP